MIRVRNITAVLVALAVLAVELAPPAFAGGNNSYQAVIRECYVTDRLTDGKYTRAALRKAKRKLPNDIREYSNCYDLINGARPWTPPHAGGGGGAGGGGAGGGGGGSGFTPPAPNPAYGTPSGAYASNASDLQALNHVTSRSRSSVPPEVALANGKVSPATGGLLSSAHRQSSNDVPLPLILALACLAALAALAGLAVVRQRWPQAIRAALRVVHR